MADTIALVNKGKVEQIGPPEALFDTPANTFVASFVGDPPMNILDTQLENGNLVIDCDVNFQFPLPKNAPRAKMDEINKKKYKVGIRPKDIQLLPGDSKSAHTRGRVKNVESLGQTTIVFLTVGCLEMKVKVETETAPKREELVSVNLDLTQLHYFDGETCVRL